MPSRLYKVLRAIGIHDQSRGRQMLGRAQGGKSLVVSNLDDRLSDTTTSPEQTRPLTDHIMIEDVNIDNPE
jgi:hypothetical protein